MSGRETRCRPHQRITAAQAPAGRTRPAAARPAALPPVLGNGRWRLLALLVGIGLGQTGTVVATALLVRSAFDQLFGGAGRAATGTDAAWLGAGLVAAAGLAAVLRAAERATAERLGQAYVSAVRSRMHRKLTRMSPRALQRRSQGTTALKFVGDMSALRRWVGRGLGRLAVGGTMLTGVLVAFVALSPPMAAGVAVVLAGGAAVTALQHRALGAAMRESRRRKARIAANITEQVSALAVVQAFGQEESERRRLRRQSRRLEYAMVRRARIIGGMRGTSEATAGLLSAVVLGVGAWEVTAGRATPGTVAAMMTVAGLLTTPVRDLARVGEYHAAARTARVKAAEFLTAPTTLREVPDAPDLVPGPGRLSFDSVRVHDALYRFSATAAPGRVVALVGPNGSGKSTLLAVAARLLDPDEGTVRLDGQDLAAHSLASVRRALGLAGPDLPLLRGDLAHNLRYRWPDAPEEELDRVVRLCRLDDLLSDLPEGMATRVAEGGRGLSAGQRQRVALARALVGGPTVLLLDEADANLDRDGAEVVDDVISQHRGVVIMATHHRDRILAADIVWHLDNGHLVEAGPPTELLSRDGPTARLLRSLPGQPPAWMGRTIPTVRV